MTETNTQQAAEIGRVLKAMEGIDQSRRVGWARHYESEAIASEAVTQLEQAVAAESFVRGVLFGVLGSAKGRVSQDAIRSPFMRIKVVNDAAFKEGITVGSAVRSDDSFLEAVRRANIKAQSTFEAGGEHAEARLAARYGFKSIDEMLGVLAKWQQATGRESRTTTSVKKRDNRRKPRQDAVRRALGDTDGSS